MVKYSITALPVVTAKGCITDIILREQQDDILEEKEGQYIEKTGFDLKMTDVFDKIKVAQNLLKKFNDNIVDMRGENHEE